MYCPYPPGIIPSDLTTESERVRREIRGIEQQAMADWAALGPLMPTSPNQVLVGNGVRAVQVLGKLENYDENLSVFKNVACAFCHMPYAGFSGPIPSVNKTVVAYPGSFHYQFGGSDPLEDGAVTHPVRADFRCAGLSPDQRRKHQRSGGEQDGGGRTSQRGQRAARHVWSSGGCTPTARYPVRH